MEQAPPLATRQSRLCSHVIAVAASTRPASGIHAIPGCEVNEPSGTAWYPCSGLSDACLPQGPEQCATCDAQAILHASCRPQPRTCNPAPLTLSLPSAGVAFICPRETLLSGGHWPASFSGLHGLAVGDCAHSERPAAPGLPEWANSPHVN